jgi:hypothetical protein
MPELLVHFSRIEQTAAEVQRLKGELEEIQDRFVSVQRSLDWELRCEMQIDVRMSQVDGILQSLVVVSHKHSTYLANAGNAYKSIE